MNHGLIYTVSGIALAASIGFGSYAFASDLKEGIAAQCVFSPILGETCDLTSRYDKTIIINRVVMNKRINVEKCNVTTSFGGDELKDKPLNLGDSVSVNFGNCGNLVVLDLYTNVGNVQLSFNP